MENKSIHFANNANNTPAWKKLVVESNIPESLNSLKEISKNLWWTWNTKARELFEYIDEEIWEESSHNPIVLLDEVNYNRFIKLEKDDEFRYKLDWVYNEMNNYLEERAKSESSKIAYFSMEYGLHDSLKIFSGGLGILAGDYLKEASDSKLNMTGIGLLYRYGYFKQALNNHGEQIANYEAEEFAKIPVTPVFVNNEWLTIEVEYPGRNLKARVWQVNVGSVKLYLLDADIEENRDEDRYITHHLYGGDNENRLKQEILLGFGGIKVLKALEVDAEVYHCNEGHAAFIGLERLKNYIEEQNISFDEACELVRGSTLFTTHTPVPAGHDSFHNDMLKKYLGAFPEKIGLNWDQFLMLGKTNMGEDHFNMSYLAANLSQNINGVSKLHGDVSKHILKDLYPGYFAEELHIGYVTNGVHYSTWAAKEWKELHRKYFGQDFPESQSDINVWNKIYDVPDEEIVELKQELKKKLIDYIKQRFSDNWIKRNENPKLITETLSKLNPEALTIGFARRFATYKRAHLLFTNLERLSKIVNNPERPVQFLFAGKAHPADGGGQALIKHIVEISKRPEFIGKILFIQNYDMNLAKMMLQGVDIWMNTPTRPLEASGTSGEKGVMNGTIHFSVLDGWWVEGYKPEAGWALPLERSFDVQEYQDELDAETIYNIFEQEIIPTYYNRNKNGISHNWVSYVKNTIAKVAPNFTMRRQLNDYIERFYEPQAARFEKLSNNNLEKAKALSAWKNKVAEAWDGIKLVETNIEDGIAKTYKTGEKHPASITIDLNGLSTDEVGVEVVLVEKQEDKDILIECHEFKSQKQDGNTVVYTTDLTIMNPGSYDYGIRIFPKNEDLPHRFDFNYVKWI
ncbi:MAG: alpha-glucan family phosphorylase [Prolixibacteraceae bacterium]|nr:alpha-glucan family phosphorylase [Prolixibacteraceae bacterium]MBN2648737.1 alpha-glucan family phosphorylase [Prolixibacteraceae bacterium]